MSYLVLAYPNISEEDFAFIQSYRERNDPKYFSLVDPHFTLVFSNDAFSEKEFIAEVAQQISGIKKFDFTIRCATMNQNDDGAYYHEFLVPDEGHSNIVKLHDALYSGKFFEHLRFDIDFIPHIGIGNSEDVHVCKKRIDALNAMNFEIRGTVEDVDIVKYDINTVTTTRKIYLQ